MANLYKIGGTAFFLIGSAIVYYRNKDIKRYVENVYKQGKNKMPSNTNHHKDFKKPVSIKTVYDIKKNS